MGGIFTGSAIDQSILNSYQGLTYRVKWGKDYGESLEQIFVDPVNSEFIEYLDQFLKRYVINADLIYADAIADTMNRVSELMYENLSFYGYSNVPNFYSEANGIELGLTSEAYLEYNKEKTRLSEMHSDGMLNCTGHNLVALQTLFSDGWRLYNVSSDDIIDANGNRKMHVHTVAAKNLGDLYGIIDSTLGIDLARKDGTLSTFVKSSEAFEKKFRPSEFYSLSQYSGNK